jgi:hypothetical protein
MHLKEHGAVEQRAHGTHGGVEALEVSGLDDARVLAGEADDLVSFGEAGGEGLLDEQVDPGTQQQFSAVGVLDGWDAEGGSVDAEFGARRSHAGGHAGFDGWEGADAIVGLGLRARTLVGVDYGRELDRKAGLLKLAVDAKVIAPEDARSHHCDPKRRGVVCRRLRGRFSRHYRVSWVAPR